MPPEAFLLPARGWVPNNPILPVLFYRGVPGSSDGLAARLAAHGWPPDWRGGIFAYHHYHTTCHEVLAVAAGSARLMLGGAGGRAIDVHGGDALVLPAGTGHCQITASNDFMVIGAYPPGQAKFDIQRAAATPAMLRRIAGVAFPDSDPVEGVQAGW